MDYQKIFNFAVDILNIPSPSGYTHNIISYLSEKASKLKLGYEVLNNNNLVISIKGNNDFTIGLSAHADTLGAMVSSINGDGTLKFDVVGGPILATYDGEYCQIHTRTNQTYSGTFLSNSPAVHVHRDANTAERTKDKMHIRLDEVVYSKDDVLKLGIDNGDYITVEPKTTITSSNFLKSRFLDDKISVAILFTLLEDIVTNKITLKNNLKVIISTYEEVGFGCSYIDGVDSLIAVDMGCVGNSLSGSEEKVSICAKDSGGPYNYELTTQLINVAKENNIDYVVDIFPYYSSDVTAALKAGNNIKGALIGPGVAASHGMERTHLNGVKNCYDLLKAYLTK